MSKVKAWVAREHGTPDTMTLEEVEPESREGHVRIAVEAAAVNFFDLLQLAGTYQVKPPFPFIPGSEVAGIVLDAPPSSGFAPGDRVLAMVAQEGLSTGGYTQITHAAPGKTVRMPDSMSFAEAAAFYVNYQTGWFGLHRRGQLKEGEVLLVHGGAGGVGTAAIQLGKAAGARVIATAGTDAKVEICKQMGADEAINYSEADFAEVVKELTGGNGADVVYDPVGGEVFERSTRCIAFEGRIVTLGFVSGTVPAARANHLLIKNYAVVGLHWGLYAERMPELVQACTVELLALYERGAIAPHVSASVPLEEAPAALVAVSERRTTGKVVLDVAASRSGNGVSG